MPGPAPATISAAASNRSLSDCTPMNSAPRSTAAVKPEPANFGRPIARARTPCSAARSNTVRDRCQVAGSIRVVPAGELVGEATGIVAHPIADQPVLAGRRPGGEGGQRGCRRRREARVDRRRLAEQRRERPRVSGTRPQCRGAQAVHHDDDHVLQLRQPEARSAHRSGRPANSAEPWRGSLGW